MRILPWYAFPLSIAVGVMVAIAAIAGLFFEATYAAEALSFATQGRAQDMITLFWVVPMFGVALRFERQGVFVARVAWLGILLYFIYTYLMASVGLAYNKLFLLYVAIYGLSLGLLVLGLTRVRLDDIVWRFSYRFPRKTVAVYSLALAFAVAFLWLGTIVQSLVTGTPPPQLAEAVTQSLVVQALDLGIVVPLAAAAGMMLLDSAPTGYLLSGMVLVKAMTLGPAMIAMAAFQVAGGMSVPALLWAFALLVTGAGAYLGYRYIKSCA
jgi:hypothetical protein